MQRVHKKYIPNVRFKEKKKLVKNSKSMIEREREAGGLGFINEMLGYDSVIQLVVSVNR